MQEFWVVCFGLCCFSVTLTLFAYFIRSKQRIGKAVAYMLAGESIGLFVASIFALTSNGVFDVMPHSVAMVLRVIAFAFALASSIHLAIVTARIQLSENSEGG